MNSQLGMPTRFALLRRGKPVLAGDENNALGAQQHVSRGLGFTPRAKPVNQQKLGDACLKAYGTFRFRLGRRKGRRRSSSIV